MPPAKRLLIPERAGTLVKERSPFKLTLTEVLVSWLAKTGSAKSRPLVA